MSQGPRASLSCSCSRSIAAGKEPDRPESRTWPSVSGCRHPLQPRSPGGGVARDQQRCAEQHEEQQHPGEGSTR